MTKKSDPKSCCTPTEGQEMCCVEAFVSVDDRGQMVIPKDVREKANICAGDKLAMITLNTSGNIRLIALIKSSDFSQLVQDFIGLKI
jgi:AbrB family looped-hinge helix DNA binding protein